MDFNLVYKTNEVMQDIPRIIEVEEGEYTTVLNVEDEIILSGIQFDKREITEQQRLKILRQLNKLEKILKINHMIINQRGVLFQGETK
ncbi:MAG: hypothetical protein SOV59_03875 [Fusobacterium mortiferum]|jgi:uncharacterized Fe-S cluster-containing MiaB family protein|nr:hypothetical protein [Fusobacterium mortiferum]